MLSSWCFQTPFGEAVSGKGGIVVVVGEPGLGKTRLVSECRKRFMAWVGAGSGRLPLWLEGRGASYASSTPYGLYQQLLSEWIGVAPEEGEEVRRPALERAMRAVFTGEDAPSGLLARMMGLGAGDETGRLSRLSPEELQRATFGALRALVSRAGRLRSDRARARGPPLGRSDLDPAHRAARGTRT